MPTFELRSPMPVPSTELASWHARPATRERLRAPWLKNGGEPDASAFEEAPGGGSLLVERGDDESVMRYRHAVARADLERHEARLGAPRMTVAISGSSGLIGRALSAFLVSGGHEVRRLPRGEIEPGLLEGLDGVVHLAGAGIADARWTDARKRAIRDTRVEGTSRLAVALARLARKPKVFASASAVGYYGPRGPEPLDETASSGSGFLAEVCRAWERSAEPAAAAGIRTVLTRFGVVLTPRGGALAKMLPAFRAGLGGPIGSGAQGFSWIAHDDAVYALHHVLTGGVPPGPVNVVAPDPRPQRDVARALGRALGRPAFLPLPAFAVRAVFGQMGEEALLSGCFAVPRRLQESGFAFAYASLDAALAHTLPRRG